MLASQRACAAHSIPPLVSPSSRSWYCSWVFGIGLMGLGKMLLVAMKSNGSSFSHAQAMVLANAMIDRIRANRTTALLGASSNYSLPALTSSISSAPDCLSGSCTGAQLATYDVANWLATQSAANGLPNAQGQIVFTPSSL